MATILILEDDEQVRVLAASFLEGEGHNALTASTGDQALAVLKSEQKIDVLFTDLNVQQDPEAGLKLARKAAALRPGLKVVYTSGQGMTDGMAELFVDHAAFLPKPYTTEQLGTMLLTKFGFGATAKPDGGGAVLERGWDKPGNLNR